MIEIKCPSCESSNIEPITTDRKLISFVMTFTDGDESRISCQCKDCGNKFQVIKVAYYPKSALVI
jgi:hypothetical protein